MKAIYYTKNKRRSPKGMTVYTMGRVIMGHQVEARLAVTARELAHHRKEVAYVLRRCRRELAREADKVWQEIANDHMGRCYGNQDGADEP